LICGRCNVLLFPLRVAMIAALASASMACAQSFPTKPVRIVVPFPVSGPPDIRGTLRTSRTYRLLAQAGPPPISDTLANIAAQAIHPHPAVVERLPGAVTSRGANAVARAPADGATLLLGSNGTMVINPHFFRGIQYDPQRDFVLVALLATMPFVLLASTDLPPETPEALIEWLRPRPGEINYGSSGDGSTGHLAGELFRRVAKTHIVHASFNGGIAGLSGLAQRQVSLMFAALPLALSYLPNKHFKPVAITSAKRAARLPDVATFDESGLRGFEVEGWYGMFARAGSPPAATAWLRERITSVMAEPATQAQVVAEGLEPATMTPGQFATRINTEYDKWAPVLRASRLPQ
jgi:tripartite-type tricarboxylate transporter receptor subunit TctC